MFALLNGEAQDYIGSSRIVYDMLNNKFPDTDLPIRMDDISFAIDINQVDKSKHLYSHVINSSATANVRFQLIHNLRYNLYIEVKGLNYIIINSSFLV